MENFELSKYDPNKSVTIPNFIEFNQPAKTRFFRFHGYFDSRLDALTKLASKIDLTINTLVTNHFRIK